ncbi:hypothetical protein AB4Y89_01135 [Terriglobus sp. 2YAB30_2]|uniref:hypothetical protein n=1 Tax=Terriglobus sp. 2YAB30_2 TaxID=3233023 RepID=UPI003F956D1A
MKRFLAFAAAMLMGAVIPGHSQSLDELNVQIHGYATQGFLYTTNNNIFTTKSSDGSPSWDEGVLNISAQPAQKLRVAVQGRYFVLGNFGNKITVDYAMADFKANDHFGVRFGKVKTPSGLFNETQDIDPSYIWALLPQSIYPISSRNSLLSHFGGVAYGSFVLGHKLGKIEYRGFAGQRTLSSDDGYFVNQTEAGILLPNGTHQNMFGGAIHWKTPLSGLMIGVSNIKNMKGSDVVTAGNGAISGTQSLNTFNLPNYFAQYEKGKYMFAAEWTRIPVSGSLALPPVITQPIHLDLRSWYVMGSYKLTDKFSAGLYHGESFDRRATLGAARYSKDWAVAARYDFSQFIYAKAEQHFIDGTSIGYDTNLNTGGLKPTTKMTVLKMGVNF